MKLLIALMLLIGSATATTGQDIMVNPDYLKMTFIDSEGVGQLFICWQENGTWMIGHVDTEYDAKAFYTSDEMGNVRIA